jgi:DNA-binding NarL/FixJ family response regulator
VGRRGSTGPLLVPVGDDTSIGDDAVVSGLRLVHVAADPFAVARHDPLAAAALRAEESAHPASDLTPLWDSFLTRDLNLHAAFAYADRSYVIACTRPGPGVPPGPLGMTEKSVLARVICGEQQKYVAAELKIAPSTVSKWYSRALGKLNLSGQMIPLPLVIAAQAWTLRAAPPPGTRHAVFEYDGERAMLLSTRKPHVANETPLSPAEREVAAFLVEGVTRSEIARQRKTSAPTVSCQIRSIYAKYRLTGRYALIRRSVELGWFA